MTTRKKVIDVLGSWGNHLLTGQAAQIYDALNAAGLLVPDETPQPPTQPKRGLARLVIRDDGRVEAYNDAGELAFQSRSDVEPGHYDWRDITPTAGSIRCQVLADRAEPPFRCEKTKGHKGPHKTTDPDRYWISAEPCPDGYGIVNEPRPEEAETAETTISASLIDERSVIAGTISAEDYKAGANLSSIKGTISGPGVIRFASGGMIKPPPEPNYAITEPMPLSLIESIEGTVWLSEHDAAIRGGIAATIKRSWGEFIPVGSSAWLNFILADLLAGNWKPAERDGL